MNSRRLYLSPPDLSNRERELLLRAFDSNWITTLGPAVDAFEHAISSYLGVRYAVALSSGTAALHLALINLGIKPGDVVLCSDLTFAASANPIVYLGAQPIFIDSSPGSWNMDPDLLDEALTALASQCIFPRAVIVVDLYGQSADFKRIREICGFYRVPIVEDAAEALGATYGDTRCGANGMMGILSFNGNKIITTSGGGMLVSENDELINKARHLSNQAREPLPYYEHKAIGYNYRLSNLLAAIGLGQLQGLDRKVARRREINGLYRSALSNISGIEFMPEAPYGRSTSWLTCITIDPAKVGATNEQIRLHLESMNIESRRVWKPMHLQPVFRECRSFGGWASEKLFEDGLCLPSGSGMTDSDVERVVESISGFVESRPKGSVHVA